MTWLSTDQDEAAVCRRKRWKVGDVLEGREGRSVVRIQLTAIGERWILARAIWRDHRAVSESECQWALTTRDWKRIPSRTPRTKR